MQLSNIGLQSLQKSTYVIREMTRYYFPLYGIAPQDYLTYSGMLLFCEGMVFEVDQDLEDASGADVLTRVIARRDVLIAALKNQQLWDQEIQSELDHLLEYAFLEYRLSKGSISAEDIWRACDLRTSDVRLLHRILVRMLERPYDPAIFELMWPLEAIMDIELDLDDYGSDKKTGSYNTLIALESIFFREQAIAELEGRLLLYGGQYAEAAARANAPTREMFEAIRQQYRADHPRVSIVETIDNAAAEKPARLVWSMDKAAKAS